MTINNTTDSNKIEKTGIIKEVLGSARFRVTLQEDNTPEGKLLAGKDLICKISGKMHQKRIKIVRGDRVKLSLSVFSSDIKEIKGVIIFRLDQLIEKKPE